MDVTDHRAAHRFELATDAGVAFAAYTVEGDTITFDIPGRKLTLNIAEEEIAARLKNFKAPEPRYHRGVFAKYANSVGSASRGAVTA